MPVFNGCLKNQNFCPSVFLFSVEDTELFVFCEKNVLLEFTLDLYNVDIGSVHTLNICRGGLYSGQYIDSFYNIFSPSRNATVLEEYFVGS